MRIRSSHAVRLLPVVVIVAALSRSLSAQAFVPPAGEGTITTTYQNALAHGHLDLNGNRMPGASCCDPVQTHAVSWDVDYGLGNRLAVDVSLPFISTRYGGPFPHPVDPEGHPSDEDDGTFHGTFQDFTIGVRFNVKARPVSVTPSVELVLPSHHYPNLAHSAPGKDLRAVVVGGAVGGFLDPVLPRLFFQAQASYAILQEVVGIRPNRTRLNSEIGYFITPRIAVRFLESYQVTHAGLDSILFAGPASVAQIHGRPDIQYTTQYRLNHDRLQRSNYLNLGGGVSIALSESFDLFAAAARTVWGENIHPLSGFSVGVTARFHTRQLFNGSARPIVPAASRNDPVRSAP